MQRYRVYSRRSWKGTKKAGFTPRFGQKREVCTGLSYHDAQEYCALYGPANKAIKAGKEYRHLPAYEFEPW